MGLLMDTLEMGKTVIKRITVYIGAITYILVPLYMRTGYFNLIDAKARAYLFTAAPAVIAVLVVAAAMLSSSADIKSRDDKRSPEGFVKKTEPSGILLILIGIWAVLSSLLSQNPELSLTGIAGWSVGSLMTSVLVLVTIIVSRHFENKPYMFWTVMAVNVFIITLAVIQSTGTDVFGLLRNISDKERYTYLSTIGQKNSFSGYLCLVLPLFWGAFITCRGLASEVTYGTFAAIGFLGIICSESDSAYAGVGICLLFMLIYVFRSEQFIKRASILLLLYGCDLLIRRHVPAFAGKTARFKGISKAMIGKPVPELICLISILLFYLGWKVIEGRKGKYILIALETTLIFIIAAYAIYTAMHFSDKWGTNRGMTWRVGWSAFKQFSLRNKITGIGPEMLVTVYARMRAETGRNVVSAHCEPLQILLTQGLIGIGLYFSFWGYLVRLFFKNKVWRDSTAVFFFPLAAYWGQSLLCSVYPVTAVVFGFAAGMYLRFAENKSVNS